MSSRDERKRLKSEYLQKERAAARSKLPLSKIDLVEFVSEAVERDGCDHPTRFVAAWRAAHDLAVDTVRAGLAEFGGMCDCEVVLNVDAADIFRD